MATLAAAPLAGVLMQLARNPRDVSPEQEAALEASIKGEVANAWFQCWEPSRYCLSLKQGNALADLILTAHAQGCDVDAALADSDCLARSDAWHTAREIARDLADRHDEALEVLTRREHAELLSELAERIEPLLVDADTSSPRDALSSCDRAEMLFVLSPPGKHPLDASIASHRPWPEFGELYVTEDLVHALACLGYTLSQYCKTSGNRHRTERARGAMRLARPGFSRRRTPLCDWSAIQEMVDNACATHFLFCVYAIVPVEQLVDLDLARPITFSKAAIATWNPWNGTFHDAVTVPKVTLTPKMGTLMSPHGWHSPDCICGFVHSYYQADILQEAGNAEPSAGPGSSPVAAPK